MLNVSDWKHRRNEITSVPSGVSGQRVGQFERKAERYGGAVPETKGEVWVEGSQFSVC